MYSYNRSASAASLNAKYTPSGPAALPNNLGSSLGTLPLVGLVHLGGQASLTAGTFVLPGVALGNGENGLGAFAAGLYGQGALASGLGIAFCPYVRPFQLPAGRRGSRRGFWSLSRRVASLSLFAPP